MEESNSNTNKEPQWHPNRSYISLASGIVLDSCFPCGNLGNAVLVSSSPLTIEVQGNCDISNDPASKYWLYFRMRGFRRDRQVKLILRNANHLRKYQGQHRYKPYMMMRDQDQQWQSCPPMDITLLENGTLQASFTFICDRNKTSKTSKSSNDLQQNKDKNAKEDKKNGDIYLSVTQPYSYDDLTTFLESLKIKHKNSSNKSVYFHEQTIAYSVCRRKIPLVTITSSDNVESFTQHEPVFHEEIFPSPKQRPLKLRQLPVILVTGRVHPSETSSSFFVQGLINFLLGENRASMILRQLFIFQILPMLNPDGVQHGNFRFDHQLRNLNRYYGQSSITATPSIRAAQLLINHFKQFDPQNQNQKGRLMLYLDIHGHSSALPSFIYGNHAQKLQYMIQNKMFCKLIQHNFISGGFSKAQSQFSKKNMTAQQKYDQFSKMGAGRVFAGKPDNNTQDSVFHSYTLQVMPYWQQSQKSRKKDSQLTASQYAQILGKQVIVSLLDLLQINPESNVSEIDMQRYRRLVWRQCCNQYARKAFLWRRAQSSVDRSSYCEISKAKNTLTQKQPNYLSQYISRWFSDISYLKHLSHKSVLLREPKLVRFFSQISKQTQFIFNQLLQNNKQQRTVHNGSQRRRQLKQSIDIKQSDNDKPNPSCNRITNICVSRQERSRINFQPRSQKNRQIKVQSKISKQTIELRDQFQQLIPRHRTVDRQNKIKKGDCIKRDDKKEYSESTQRYQLEIARKIQNGQRKKQAVFDIKIKQLKPKIKSDPRLLTQIPFEPISSTAGIDNSLTPDHKMQSCSHKSHAGSTEKGQQSKLPRGSFIQEFIMKIREQRQGLTSHTASKYPLKEEIRHKILKYRPSLRDALETPEKSLLPVLRRNKIFTIASQPQNQQVFAGYDSVGQNKRRAVTLQSDPQLDDIANKTRKIMARGPRQYSRQNPFRRSQKLTQETLH